MSSPERSASMARAGVASAIRAAPSPAASGLAPAPPSTKRGDEEPQLVDLAGIEERAGQGRAALQQQRDDPAATKLGERRGDAGGRLPVADDQLGPGPPERLHPLAGRGGRDDHDQRRLAGRADQPGAQRQAGHGVEHDPGGLARIGPHRGRPRGEQRVVGQRGADPDADGVALGPPAVREGAAVLAGDPPRVAARARHPAVEAEGRLQEHERAARAGVLSKGLIQKPRGGRLGAVGQLDLDALVAKDPRAAAARLLARVLGGDHDARDPRREDGPGAGRLAPLVGAGLESHVQGRPRRVVSPGAAVVQGRDLGVGPAQPGVEPLADRLAVAHQHGADERVGADPAAAALGQLQRPSEVEPVLCCDDVGHLPDGRPRLS